MHPIVQRLKERKLVQWALAYLSGAWLIVQGIDALGARWGVSDAMGRSVDVVLIVGFFIALVLAWYHGEQGRQRVSGPELLMIGGLFALTAAVLTVFGGDRETAADSVDAVLGRAPEVVLRDRPAIAVLPFDNMSPDPDNAYFAAGMHEQIISQLSQISGLIVIARTSVMRYADAPKSIREVAEELGVDYVLEGSARKSGDRIRLTAQLIAGQTEESLWAEDFDRDLTITDIFKIQDDVAERVVASLSATILPSEASRMGERPTESLEAYERFLKGNYYLAQRTATGFRTAVAEYEASSRADPDFVGPVSRVGYAYAMLLGWGWGYRGLPTDSLLARGRDAVDRAIRQDPGNSDAWMARGFLRTTGNAATYEGVADALEQAISLNPRNAEAHHIYGWVLGVLGDALGAMPHFESALAIEPGRSITLSSMAEMSLREHRFDEARRWADSTLAVDPGYWFAYAWRARVRLQTGQVEEARNDAASALQLSGGESIPALTAAAMAMARVGDTISAHSFVERALRSTADSATAGRFVAMALVALGEIDSALELLESVRPRGVLLRAALRMPEFDPIRDRPRFQALFERYDQN